MNVSESLEKVYEVFGGVAKPNSIEGCPCCVTQDEIIPLLTTPLREITPDQLSSYASSVFLTVGDVSDFRYFLPRILDISIHDRNWWPDSEIVLGKLSLAGWASWPHAETGAIHTLLESAFDEVILHRENAAADVDGWICGLALAGVDVAPYLHKLQEPAFEMVLIGFFEENITHARRGRLANPFWDGRWELAAPVVAWLQSTEVESIVRRYYGGA